jgi:predicted HicB family RNase H-like nuclease
MPAQTNATQPVTWLRLDPDIKQRAIEAAKADHRALAQWIAVAVIEKLERSER